MYSEGIKVHIGTNEMNQNDIMQRQGVYIIAEAGVNHNGDVAMAEKMIDIAAEAGADAVKFQTFKASRLAARDAIKAKYQKVSTNIGESQYDMLKRLELDLPSHRRLMERCRKRGIEFVSSPFDAQSARDLAALGLRLLKVPSGEVINIPYLRVVGSLGIPVVMSTGMTIMEEVRAGMNALIEGGLSCENLTILHCNTEYPTPFEDVNLLAMISMARELGVRVGYSDHTTGLAIPVAAVALGARMLEKHFTLDKTLPGPDHAASLEPSELTAMVNAVRAVELAMGNGIKRPSPSESSNIHVVRKSIVAARDINAGERFSAENLDSLRPGTGISPLHWDDIVGRKAKRDFKRGEMVEL